MPPKVILVPTRAESRSQIPGVASNRSTAACRPSTETATFMYPAGVPSVPTAVPSRRNHVGWVTVRAPDQYATVPLGDTANAAPMTDLRHAFGHPRWFAGQLQTCEVEVLGHKRSVVQEEERCRVALSPKADAGIDTRVRSVESSEATKMLPLSPSIAVKRKRRPSGRSNGPMWPDSWRTGSRVVIGVGVPPAAATRNSASVDPRGEHNHAVAIPHGAATATGVADRDNVALLRSTSA